MAAEYIEETIGYVKGPKGDPGVKGDQGIQGPPGVTTYATTSSAGLVRIGADHKISDAGVLSLNTETTKASTLAELVLDGTEAWATTLGKLAKAVSTVVTIAGDYLKATQVYNGLDKSATGFALDASQGKALNDKITKLGNIEVVLNATGSSGSFAAQNAGVYFCSISDGNTGAAWICCRKGTANAGISEMYNNSASRFSASISNNTVTLSSAQYGANIVAVRII